MSISYLHLRPEQDPPSLGDRRSFRAVIVLAQATSAEWRDAVSRWLVESGCLYMMAWGEGSSAWDDSVDLANLETFGFGEIPEDRVVMTTWHDNETLSEAFGFSYRCAHHPTVALNDTIIVDVGPRDRRVELIKMLEEAQRAG